MWNLFVFCLHKAQQCLSNYRNATDKVCQCWVVNFASLNLSRRYAHTQDAVYMTYNSNPRGSALIIAHSLFWNLFYPNRQGGGSNCIKKLRGRSDVVYRVIFHHWYKIWFYRRFIINTIISMELDIWYFHLMGVGKSTSKM